MNYEAPQPLYSAWRQEFQAAILSPNQMQSKGQIIDLGFELSQIKEVKLLKSYQDIANSKNPRVESLLLNKLRKLERGDEFLAFAFCHIKGWDPDQLLARAGSPGNAHALPSVVLAEARREL